MHRRHRVALVVVLACALGQLSCSGSSSTTETGEFLSNRMSDVHRCAAELEILADSHDRPTPFDIGRACLPTCGLLIERVAMPTVTELDSQCGLKPSKDSSIGMELVRQSNRWINVQRKQSKETTFIKRIDAAIERLLIPIELAPTSRHYTLAPAEKTESLQMRVVVMVSEKEVRVSAAPLVKLSADGSGGPTLVPLPSGEFPGKATHPSSLAEHIVAVDAELSSLIEDEDLPILASDKAVAKMSLAEGKMGSRPAGQMGRVNIKNPCAAPAVNAARDAAVRAARKTGILGALSTSATVLADAELPAKRLVDVVYALGRDAQGQVKIAVSSKGRTVQHSTTLRAKPSLDSDTIVLSKGQVSVRSERGASVDIANIKTGRNWLQLDAVLKRRETSAFAIAVGPSSSVAEVVKVLDLLAGRGVDEVALLDPSKRGPGDKNGLEKTLLDTANSTP